MPPYSTQKTTGFKTCHTDRKQMSVMDLHNVCLWCLESKRDSKSCNKFSRMHLKAIKERQAKLYAESTRNGAVCTPGLPFQVLVQIQVVFLG